MKTIDQEFEEQIQQYKDSCKKSFDEFQKQQMKHHIELMKYYLSLPRQQTTIKEEKADYAKRMQGRRDLRLETEKNLPEREIFMNHLMRNVPVSEISPEMEEKEEEFNL